MGLDFGGINSGLFGHSNVWGLGVARRGSETREFVVAPDGTGHFGSITEALAELGTRAGTIRVKAGTYTIETLQNLSANQEIIGSGFGTILSTSNNIAVLASSSDNVIIQNLKIQGSKSGSGQTGIALSGDKCRVINCFVEDMGDEGITISGDHNVVNDCVVDDCVGDGIQVIGALGCSIIGNQIMNHGDSGLYFLSATKCLVQGNYFFSNGDNNTNGDGIQLDGTSHNNCINGNVLHTNDGYGVDIQSGAQKNIVVGNHVLNNEDGQVSDAGTSSVVANNVTA